MKTYKEMANDALKEIKKERKQRNKITAIVCCLIVALVIVGSLPKEEIMKKEKYIVLAESNNKEDETFNWANIPLIEQDKLDLLHIYTNKTATAILSNYSDENIVYSPANMYFALGMLSEIVAGESQKQLLDLVGLQSIEESRELYDQLWRHLYKPEDQGNKLILANSIWLNNKCEYKIEPLKLLSDKYLADSYAIEMGNKESDHLIGKWLNSKTNNLLENYSNNIETTENTLMDILSTIYLKEGFNYPFQKEDTYQQIFTNNHGQQQTIDFMHQTLERNWYATQDYTISELPLNYGRDMVVLLPNENVSIDDSLINALLNYNHYELDCGLVKWSVPKFDVDFDIKLNEILEQLGVSDIFDEQKADFSPITDVDAYVSKICHAGRVKVDENGVEAAAVTEIIVEYKGMPLPNPEVIEMNLNRPFIFMIEGVDGLPLFIGVVNNVK